MRRDIPSGTLLIAGALAGLFAMGLHPTGGDLLDFAERPGIGLLNTVVHGTAIAGVPLVFLGLLGLARRLEYSALTTPALVAYATGGISVISAGVMSGFVAMPVIHRMAGADQAARNTWEALLSFTGMLNHGFAAVFVVASFAAILLWSAAVLRSGRLQRAVGIAGLVVGALGLLAFLSGHVHLDVHGFGLIMLVQAVWMIWVGVLLLRDGPAPGDD